jgi:S-formylglutathione hydrolase FrmB
VSPEGEALLFAPLDFEGRVEIHMVESARLRDNPLGDPWRRELPVYLPPGAEEPGARFPVLFLLAGYTSRGQSFLETHPWRRGVVWHYDQAIARGEVASAILVAPDCFTRLGGSQYVNSSAVGAYEDHLIEELVPLADALPAALPGRRGILGKSSGGIGALHQCMQHPGLFRACASISGDCAFEATLPTEFLACLEGLVPHGGDPARFLQRFAESPRLRGQDHAVLLILAMAACYSPNPGSPLGFDLPFDLTTGELITEVWERWLAFDPLLAVEHHVEALRTLDLLHLECGLADEFHLQWGARRLSRKLHELSIPHVHEEHDGGHRGIDERYLPILDRMARALQG